MSGGHNIMTRGSLFYGGHITTLHMRARSLVISRYVWIEKNRPTRFTSLKIKRRPPDALSDSLIFYPRFPTDIRTMFFRCPCDTRPYIDRFFQIVRCSYGHRGSSGILHWEHRPMSARPGSLFEWC